jgi:hypothetical protein
MYEAGLHAPLERRLGADRLPAAVQHLMKQVPRPSSFIATVLALMAEVAKGDTSAWLPYVLSLPASCDCLLSWAPEDKAHLKGGFT